MRKNWQKVFLGMGSGAVMLCSMAAMAEAAPIHVQVANGDVRSVLLSAARMGGFNLVMDDEVSGSVTLNLYEEPERVMTMVAASKGLLLTRDGNNFIVAVGSRAAGLRSIHTYKAKYANPQDLARAVNFAQQEEGKKDSAWNKDNITDKNDKKGESRQDSLPKNCRAIVDEASGLVVFYGTETEARAAEKVMRRLDAPASQVSLEAKVVALSRSASRELGVDWQWSALPQYPEYTKSWRRDSKGNEYSETEVHRQWNGSEQVPGIIRFGHGPEGQPFEFYFSAKLNALISDGKAKVLARPNITTLQGHEAVINIGGEVPVPTQTVTNSTTTTTMNYRQAGIILRCTPRVNAQNHITAAVHTEVSTPLFVTDLKAYQFQKRSADTLVRLRDGETMIIGGLIGSEESRTLSKIPLLGDIPVLGNFFRSLKKSRTESEIMIFLTAHIIDDSAGTADKGQQEQ